MAEQTATTTSHDVSSTSNSLSTGNAQPTQHNGSSDKSPNQSGSFALLLFAAASTYTGTDNLTLPAPMTLKQLFDTLEKSFPGIKKKVLRSSAVTVNLEYVEFEVDEEGNIVSVEGRAAGGGEEGDDGDGGAVAIKKGDEVGIIPPVSSG